MICGELPCICGGVKPKRATRTKTVRKVETVKPNFHAEAVIEQDRDLSLESALTAVRDIVCAKDRAMIDQKLRPSRSTELDKELTAWKRRIR
jgi:hypothetical protein